MQRREECDERRSGRARRSAHEREQHAAEHNCQRRGLRDGDEQLQFRRLRISRGDTIVEPQLPPRPRARRLDLEIAQIKAADRDTRAARPVDEVVEACDEAGALGEPEERRPARAAIDGGGDGRGGRVD